MGRIKSSLRQIGFEFSNMEDIERKNAIERKKIEIQKRMNHIETLAKLFPMADEEKQKLREGWKILKKELGELG